MTLVRGILANAPDILRGQKCLFECRFAIAGAMMEKAGLPFEKLLESRLFDILE